MTSRRLNRRYPSRKGNRKGAELLQRLKALPPKRQTFLLTIDVAYPDCQIDDLEDEGDECQCKLCSEARGDICEYEPIIYKIPI